MQLTLGLQRLVDIITSTMKICRGVLFIIVIIIIFKNDDDNDNELRLSTPTWGTLLCHSQGEEAPYANGSIR